MQPRCYGEFRKGKSLTDCRNEFQRTKKVCAANKALNLVETCPV
jgi:hypothetical protein